MATLSEIKAKYNMIGGNYDPNPACKFCNGSGEKIVKRTGKLTFCICLFVDHSASDDIGTLLGKFATDQLKRMEK